MPYRLILTFLLITACTKFKDTPTCLDLQYKMSLEQVLSKLNRKPNQLLISKSEKDFSEYRAGKCIFTFHKKSKLLIEAKYEVFSRLSTAGDGAVPKIHNTTE